MALTGLGVRKAQSEGKELKLYDSGGLFLLVTKSGKKYWRLKYRLNGKEKKLAIGVYPDVSLKEARVVRDNAKKKIANGIDPSAEKRARRFTTSQDTFKNLALEWLSVKLADKVPEHQYRVRRILERELFPDLGCCHVGDISAPDLLQVLRKIENRGHIETAHRTKQIAGQVFRYAIACGKAQRDPSVDLKGALRTPKERHFSAITTPKEAGQLMLAIDNFSGTMIVKAGLKLSALFFCRPGNLRHLEWRDVNWDESRIEIPAERMKIHADHIIPLSTQAIEVLKQVQTLTWRDRYILSSARGGDKPMSENAVRAALRKMGYKNSDMTAHGFRAMARTMLDEILGYPIEWIEQQLAHTVRDANGRAYNRTKHLKQRAEMMQHWADYLEELKEAERRRLTR